MANQSKFATVEQESPSRPPVLTAGDLTPAVARSFEMACLGYFEHKDIAEDKQVRKILAGLQDSRMQDWVSVDRDRFLALSFPDFMKEFRAGYLPEDWEEITRIELLAMTQNDLPFWDFAIQVQAKNSLLQNTPSYLATESLRHRIESGMTQKLALRCRLEKLSKTEAFKDWLTEVKHVDDLVRAERADFEMLAKATRDAGRRTNTLTEPSRRVNTNNNGTSASTSTRVNLPKLTDVERRLLYDNDGCLKCRRVFVTHRTHNCPNDFPDPTTYKPLTQMFVDAINRHGKKNVASVMLTGENTVTPVSAQPIAVVMGTSSNPVAYMPSNTSNVIEGDSVDSENSVSRLVATVIHPTPSTLKASVSVTAPLTVPHLFWKCSVSGSTNSFPVTINALIDDGSHTVLISESLTKSLGLKRRKLHEPMYVEMAMPEDGSKCVVQLNEWVKLSLYDVSGLWTSKTVRAVIAPSLCAPVILGLPFLSHNNIVIDHSARTVIDKISGFDLLHPPPPPAPKIPKLKLKEFFLQLKADRALMLAELKMVCAERKVLIRSLFEKTKPVEPLAALRQRIETRNLLGGSLRKKH
jgi:hypothetical protein